ncbi:T-cell immunoglobulin and mucin domain-containing protein 4-like isoform X4 [Xiphias gladius]|uniref:T-cell immunoglobulin and mucin domain-containing protein 4-like isoform X4 n=1 Tax=Xiphias gladius TaxID=8245 RepID=UPI001A997EB4|nr:T-cell immunoglobulin and mucin domain-containing protein 4-like isoform X4 [Xiphias gladius]
MRGLCFFFLSILTQVSSKTLSDVIGVIGHNVTLPCRYDTQTHGVLSFCWGQGKVPRFKCSRPILSSQHGAVQFRQSSRYQLLGRVTDGDMSLTILNAQWSDAGVYGCRVEIPGWFNDYKVNTHLAMEEAPVEHPVTQDSALATGGRHGKIQSLSESGEHWQDGSYFLLFHNHNPRLYFPEKVSTGGDTSTSQPLSR